MTHYLVKWCSLPYEESTWELEEDVDPAKVKEFESLQVLPEVKHMVMCLCVCLTPLVTCKHLNLEIIMCIWLGYWMASSLDAPSPWPTSSTSWSALALNSVLMCITYKKLGCGLVILVVHLSFGTSNTECRRDGVELCSVFPNPCFESLALSVVFVL